MKKTSSKIVFFGNERLATGITTDAPVLTALIKNGYEIAAVITNYSEAISRNSRQLEIKLIADRNNIPVLIPNKLINIKDELKSYGALVGVLVAYGKMVPLEIIDIFPEGIINIHPSLLPLHRGSTPIESVILDGSSETGVSLMKLVKAMDAGPIYDQQTQLLSGQESKQELADLLSKIGANLVIKNLPSIIDKTIHPVAQNESLATYDNLITKSDGVLNWNQSANQIERKIRAYAGWPGARSELMGKDVSIIRVEVTEYAGAPGKVLALNNQLVVCCKEQAIRILSLKPAGKQEMTGQAFLAGHSRLL